MDNKVKTPTLEDSTLKLGLNDCSNADYHADKYFISSTNYKTLLKDPQKFYKEKILGERDSKSNGAFDEGSLTHALILEPDVIKDEFAFYQGMVKRGKEFERFKEEQKNKIIISKPQKMRCESYLKAYEKCPTAVDLLKDCDFEYTICQNLNGIATKIRADVINIEKGFIADVKTTRHASDKDSFKFAMEDYGYGLSACLYAAVASEYYGKPFDFYFVVISKSELTCDVFKASSKTLAKGMKDIKAAAAVYKKCIETGLWELPQTQVRKKINSKYKIEEI